MDPAWIISSVSIIATVTLTVSGWLIARTHTLNQVISTQRETIDTLRRQVDRLEITAELTDKIMNQLPKQRASGSAK